MIIQKNTTTSKNFHESLQHILRNHITEVSTSITGEIQYLQLRIYFKNCMVESTKKNGYLSCIFPKDATILFDLVVSTRQFL